MGVHGTAGWRTRHGHWVGCLLLWCNLQNLALSFYQVNELCGALFGQDAYSDQQ